MKTSVAAVLAFLSAASAFAPLQETSRPSLALSSSTVPQDVQPNPAIKVMAQGMSLLKPVFAAEAKLQASVLGFNVDDSKIVADIQDTVSKNKIVIYTYSLSPFSGEAVRLLEESGYDFEQITLGPEWFLLGPEKSVARVELSKLTEGGATSLPKIFVGGECIGGCSELASLVESGEFDSLVKQKKGGAAGAKKMFGLFQ